MLPHLISKLILDLLVRSLYKYRIEGLKFLLLLFILLEAYALFGYFKK